MIGLIKYGWDAHNQTNEIILFYLPVAYFLLGRPGLRPSTKPFPEKKNMSKVHSSSKLYTMPLKYYLTDDVPYCLSCFKGGWSLSFFL